MNDVSAEELKELREKAAEYDKRKAKEKRSQQRYAAELYCYKNKAIKAGITVTEEEIDKYIKNMKTRKK